VVVAADQGGAVELADFQYDLHDKAQMVQPYGLWRRLRREVPALRSDRYGGFWFVGRYEDVRNVLIDHQTFTTSDGVSLPRFPTVMLPLEVDPPLHRKYRALLNPLLAPQRVVEHEDWIRREAKRCVEAIAGRSEFDAYSDFARPFANRIALRLLGFPEGDLGQLEEWTHTLIAGTRDDPVSLEVGAKFVTYLVRILEERELAEPAEDIISVIAHGEVDDRPLTPDEKLSLLQLMTQGGLSTMSATLAGALVWLADHTEDRTRLRADPNLMVTAVEEFVRYVSPTTQLVRTAVDDTALGGCPIHRGDKVLFGIGSANHDEDAFDRPDEVVIDRYPNKHFGFGAGPHRCVGSHFAKLGLRIGLDEFLQVFDDFELADRDALRWHVGEARELESAPMKVANK
jgi:cytochrome P450